MNLLPREGQQLMFYRLKCACGFKGFAVSEDRVQFLPFACSICRLVVDIERDWMYEVRRRLEQL